MGGKAGAPRVGLGRSLTRDDVSAPAELRAALLQVSQGVEHLHSLRIVHRCAMAVHYICFLQTLSLGVRDFGADDDYYYLCRDYVVSCCVVVVGGGADASDKIDQFLARFSVLETIDTGSTLGMQVLEVVKNCVSVASLLKY